MRGKQARREAKKKNKSGEAPQLSEGRKRTGYDGDDSRNDLKNEHYVFGSSLARWQDGEIVGEGPESLELNSWGAHGAGGMGGFGGRGTTQSGCDPSGSELGPDMLREGASARRAVAGSAPVPRRPTHGRSPHASSLEVGSAEPAGADAEGVASPPRRPTRGRPPPASANQTETHSSSAEGSLRGKQPSMPYRVGGHTESAAELDAERTGSGGCGDSSTEPPDGKLPSMPPSDVAGAAAESDAIGTNGSGPRSRRVLLEAMMTPSARPSGAYHSPTPPSSPPLAARRKSPRSLQEMQERVSPRMIGGRDESALTSWHRWISSAEGYDAHRDARRSLRALARFLDPIPPPPPVLRREMRACLLAWGEGCSCAMCWGATSGEIRRAAITRGRIG